ncbi:uncharacterized protein LOC135811870 isoform X2 [Sycon ciliatum]|uniref:uncharacterized protein LOC135811870 isoform X2 n=1 Tax=Sycon ciliatum TaxID=27933 RepID=UPI0031F6FB27
MSLLVESGDSLYGCIAVLHGRDLRVCTRHDVEDAVEAQTGLSARLQRLFLNNKKILVSKTLAEQGLSLGSRLDLHIAIKGGMPHPQASPVLEEHYADSDGEKSNVIDNVSECVFTDPVFTALTGHTYSRSTLVQNNLVEPLSGEKLKEKQIIPNINKATEVDQYLDRRLKADIRVIRRTDFTRSPRKGLDKLHQLVAMIVDRTDLRACLNAKRLLREVLLSRTDGEMFAITHGGDEKQFQALLKLARVGAAEKLEAKLLDARQRSDPASGLSPAGSTPPSSASYMNPGPVVSAGGKLVQHMAEDCPNKTVVCPYHQYSCAFEGTREQVDRHCESQKEHHMHLVSQQTKSQEGTGDAAAVPSISELEAAEQEAARLGGTTVIQFLHVAILGAARVGKTSLLKALLEKMYNEDELSTPGMRTSYASTNISADCRFIECSDMPDALSRLYVSTMMCKSSTSNHPQDKETTQDEQERATAEEDPVAGTANNRHSQPTAIHQQRDEPAMREEIHETITGFLNADRVKYISDRANTPDYTVITFRDLGGQQVYQSVQPLFMAKNTTFIATYNSSLDLLEALPKLDELQVSREECIERATLPADATRLDQLLGWLDILLLNAKADSNSTDQSAADDVFVVGCQSDRWNETDLPDPCKLLHERIKGSPYQNLVWNETSHFKIDNTRSTGSAAQPDELQRLREAIIDRCRKSQRSIPVPWLRFCITIHLLKQEASWPWISFEEAKFIAKQVKAVPSDYSDWQIQQLLKYCHEAGHLVYLSTFKLKDTIILDPQFILDCVNAFVYLKPDRHITADEMRRYHSGFMTESLARKALNKMFEDPSYFDHAKAWQAVKASSDGFKLIFEILEWLSVLAIVQDESSAEHEFIVPAVVEDMDMHPQTPSCSCAYVSLKHASHDECMRFPVFLYWQCVVEALLKSRKRSAATLSRCSVRLRWNSEWPWLNLHYTRYGLQVYVECKGRDGGSGKSTLEEVKAIVLTVLRKWNLQAEVISSLPCPCGETSGVECLQHGLSTCCTPSCAHALDASTLVAEDYPLCTRSKPDTQMIREQAKFWLGLDQDARGMLFDPRSASLPSETWTYGVSGSGGHGVSGSDGYGVSGSGGHGVSGSGRHGVGGSGRHGVSGSGRHGVSGSGGYGVSGSGGHGVSGSGHHGVSGSGGHGVSGSGGYGASGSGRHGVSGSGGQGVGGSGRHGVSGSGRHGVSGSGGYGVSGSGRHGVSGSGGHGVSGSGGYGVSGCGSHGVSGSGGHGVSGSGGHGVSGSGGHGISGSGGHGVSGSGGYGVSGSGGHGVSGSGHHGVSGSGGHGVSGSGGYGASGSGRHGVSGSGGHGVGGSGRHGVSGSGRHGVSGSGGYGVSGSGRDGVSGSGGHGVSGSGGYGVSGSGSHGVSGSGGHGVSGSGRHGVSGSGGHGVSGSGRHGVSGSGGYGVSGSNGHGIGGSGGHGVSGSGGHGVSGSGGHGVSGGGGHGVSGSGGHGVSGSGGYGVSGSGHHGVSGSGGHGVGGSGRHGVSGSGGHGVSGSGRHGADGSGVHDSDFMSLGAIGEKTIDLIDDWSAFVSSIEPFIGGEEEGDERAKCGKAAVELVDPAHKNQYTTVLRSFHEMKKGYIRGTGKGENNLFCILVYLMQRPATTVQQLFNLLAASAKHNRCRLFSTIKNAKYLK